MSPPDAPPSGGSFDHVTTSSTMGEILDAYPGARLALAVAFHIGGCPCSEYERSQTLSDVVRGRDFGDPERVLAYLKESYVLERPLQVGPFEVADRLRRGDPVCLVDVRPETEWAIARIPGSRRLTDEVESDLLATWPREAPVVVVCHFGDRSLDVARRLIAEGFVEARALAGGIEGWSLDIDGDVPRYHTSALAPHRGARDR